jgi:hypothetical protein
LSAPATLGSASRCNTSVSAFGGGNGADAGGGAGADVEGIGASGGCDAAGWDVSLHPLSPTTPESTTATNGMTVDRCRTVE